jgi:lantibiotic modifying enzyme
MLPDLLSSSFSGNSGASTAPPDFADQIALWQHLTAAAREIKYVSSHQGGQSAPGVADFCNLIVDYALHLLYSRCRYVNAWCTGTAIATLRSSLFVGIRLAIGQVVEHERLAYRMLHGTRSTKQKRKRSFDDFEAVFFREATTLFSRRYKVLPRILSTTIQDWIAFNAELFTRIESDRVPIEKRLRCSAILPRIISLKEDVSDKHTHGRSVAVIDFEDGTSIVYKPRSLAADNLLGEFISWGLRAGDLPEFRIPSVLNCEGYGWAEYIAHQNLTSVAAAKRFYERSGMMLFALYALNGTDAHHNNIIAHGEYPVLVDMETVMHQDLTNTGTGYSSLGNLMASVLRTGMLPRWQTGIGGIPQRIGGLIQETVESKTHLPLLPDGSMANPSEFMQDILRGFRKFYLSSMSKNGELLPQGFSLFAIRHVEMRFVFRGTQAYAEVRRRSLHPRSLSSGIDRSIALELLAHLFLSRHGTPRSLPPEILRHELAALERADVPIFHARLGSRSLYANEKLIVRNFFPKSMLRVAKERLTNLSQDDLATQVEIVKSAFSLQSVEFDDFGKFKPSVQTRARTCRYVAFAHEQNQSFSEQCRDVAERIGDYLIDRSFQATDGSIDWIVPRLNRHSQVYNLSNIDHSLFQGRSGIGLFLSALAYRTHHERFKKAAMAVLDPSATFLYERRSYAFSTNGIGVMDGAFGIVYSLGTAGRLLQETRFIDVALDSLKHVDIDSLWENKALDLVSGVAGPLLVLCSLRKHYDDPNLWKLAQPCIEHLLARRVRVRNGCAWPTLDGRKLTGLSHGASGIALSLARAWMLDPNRELLDTIRGAVRYERGSYNPDAMNWPDLRYDRLRYGLGWSHGAPGIGLARLGMGHLNMRGIKEDLEHSLEAIDRFRGQTFDYVVSGRASHVAFLSALRGRIEDPRVNTALNRIVETMISQARRSGSFRLPFKPGRVMTTPALFTGLAGIGFALMQACDPLESSVPNVWTLD